MEVKCLSQKQLDFFHHTMAVWVNNSQDHLLDHLKDQLKGERTHMNSETWDSIYVLELKTLFQMREGTS